MTITISVGSGKGGTGKSMVVANLAALLAKAGKKVCVVDLDLGGPDMHTLYGLFQPELTLTDFLTRKVPAISDVIHTLNPYGVQLICGTGDTLQTANMSYQEKQRLLRSFSTIEADVLLVDVGAGTGYHALDFFMHSDIQLCVTTPDPPAILDFYTFIQLATIRKALGSFLSSGEVAKTLKKRNFDTLAGVMEIAEILQPGARLKAQQALEKFNPLLIVNKVSQGARLNTLKLRKLTSRYLGIYLPDLGEIPYDDRVTEALRAYLPVAEYAPKAPASNGLVECSSKLVQVIDLFVKKRRSD